jgi:ribosomal protein S1
MKRKILVALAVFIVVMSLLLVSCNKQIFDTTYSYDRATLSLPNGEVIDGKVTSWKDYEDGDQIQVKINGVSYLVHSSNIVLIDE